MRILITGGSGFIGTNLVQHWLGQGIPVLSLDRSEPRHPGHAGHFKQVDLLDADAMRDSLTQFLPTHVLHMGARTDLAEGDVEQLFGANTRGTANLIQAMRAAGSVERCLFASTKLVCRNGAEPPECGEFCPDTCYGESKVRMEIAIRQAEMPWSWCIVRPTSIWGPWFDIPYRGFFTAIARGRYLHIGRVDPPRAFGYVGNAVHQIQSLVEAPAEAIQGQAFYLADYSQYRIRSWAEQIAAAMGKGPLRTLPEPIVRLVAKGGDLLKACGWKNPPMTSFRLRNMRTDTSHAPMDNLRPLTGELPYGIDRGVEETVGWLRSQHLI